MVEAWKVYIKGVPGRGKEVIKILTDLGGKESNSYLTGANKRGIYYIQHNLMISFAAMNTEMSKIIMDNYKEIKLPEQWKNGDILVNKNANYKFCVFDDYLSRTGSGNDLFFFHCEVAGHKGERYLKSNSRRYFHDVNDYRIATPQEVEHFHELMHKYGKDWDAEKKEVVDWKWEPKEGDDYYCIYPDGDVSWNAWDGDSFDVDCYNFGNCFRTEEEAEAMAEKIKNLLKDNL